jgi:tetratricopeptide (TPR) repeat protein
MNLLHASDRKMPRRIDLDSYSLLVQDASQDFAELQSLEHAHEQRSHLLDKALHKVKQALEVNPKGIKGLNLFARIELFSGNVQKAQLIIERALIVKPDSPTALYSAGHIALALGQLTLA